MSLEERICLNGQEASILSYLTVHRNHKNILQDYAESSKNLGKDARNIAEYILNFHGAYLSNVISTGKAIIDWADR